MRHKTLFFVICWFGSLMGVFIVAKQIPRGSHTTEAESANLFQPPESHSQAPNGRPDHQQAKESQLLRASPDQLNLPPGMSAARREALVLYLGTQDPTARKFWRSRIFDGLETADYPLMAQAIIELAGNREAVIDELTTLMKTWSARDPFSAIQYLSLLTNYDAARLIPDDFSERWYEENPEIALDWAWNAPASMKTIGRDIIKCAVVSDPQSFFDRLLNQPLSTDEKRYGIFWALQWWDKDPDLAFSYLSALSDGPISLQNLKQMGLIYGRQSVEDGYRWAQELSLPAQRYAALQGVIDAQISQNPRTAMDTLLEWGDPYMIDRNFVSIGRNLIHHGSYDEASEWIDSFEPNPKVQELYYYMAEELTRMMEADLESKKVLPETVMAQAEEWLSRISDEKERKMARERIRIRIDDASQGFTDPLSLDGQKWYLE